MDTERLFLTHGISIDYNELSANELKDARHFVEITRHLQEIHHLFLIFKYDIDQLTDKYVLMSGGGVFRNQKPANSEEDYIAVNSHIVCIISAGRTLVESMECYINENSEIDEKEKDRFLNYCHKAYDSSFAYRLLIRLRDYSQHGHLPVSSRNNNYCFDLVQIKNKPHFNHNKKVESELNRIIDEIITKYDDSPTLSLTESLAEFVVKLLSVYRMFWDRVQPELNTAYERFQKVIASNRGNIISRGCAFTGLFVYDFIDGNMHVADPEDNARKMVNGFIKEAKSIYGEYVNAYRDVMDGKVFISISDDRILVDPGSYFAEKVVDDSENEK